MFLFNIAKELFHQPANAELRPGQTGQDTLPPYEVLDGILAALIEDEASI
jgi:NH3-dependent NAD+ synthetase